MPSPKPFAVSKDDDALVLTLQGQTDSLSAPDLLREMDALLSQLDFDEIRGAVVDFNAVDYFGSEVLEALLRLWNRIDAKGGRFAVCNLSKVGRDILELAKFDTLWDVADSREQALKALKGG